MRHVEAPLAHLLQDGGRRRCRGRHDLAALRERTELAGFGVEHDLQNDRSAAEIPDRVVGQGVVDPLRAHLAQTDAGAGLGGQRPGKAPAVAVEHRQGPQIDRRFAHVPFEDVAKRQEVGAAVVIEHTLGASRRAGGVVEGDRIPFVGGTLAPVRGIARTEQGLVVRAAELLARGRGIADVDDDGRLGEGCQRLLHDRCEFRVGQQHLGAAVIQDIGDRRGIESGVDGIEDPAGHRDGEMRFEELRRVRRHHRHRLARLDAEATKRRGEPSAAIEGLGPAAATVAVDGRSSSGMRESGAMQEGDRR